MNPIVRIALSLYVVAQLAFALWTRPEELTNLHTWQWIFWGGIVALIILDFVTHRRKTSGEKE